MLAVLPAICFSAVAAFDCGGQQCSDHAIAAFHLDPPPSQGELVAVRASTILLVCLSSPLPLPLALALIGGSRRVVAGCCCGRQRRRPSAPSGAVDLGVSILAAAAAYVLAAAAAAVPAASLMPACGLIPSDASSAASASAALATFGASLAALVALHSLLFASSNPRGVVTLAVLAFALFGGATYESLRRQLEETDIVHIQGGHS